MQRIENTHPNFLIRGLSVELTGVSEGPKGLGGPERPERPGKKDVHETVERIREELTSLYGSLERKELKQLEMFRPYVAHFKSFKKTYHLFLQLESFVHKQRPLPFIHPMVSAYFLTELETGVLASAHDSDSLSPGFRLKEAAGDETLTLLNGEERLSPAGDAVLEDQTGLLTSVIQGQDRRTVIGPKARRGTVFVYGPPGASTAALEKALDVFRGHLAEWYGKEGIVIEEIL